MTMRTSEIWELIKAASQKEEQIEILAAERDELLERLDKEDLSQEMKEAISEMDGLVAYELTDED